MAGSVLPKPLVGLLARVGLPSGASTGASTEGLAAAARPGDPAVPDGVERGARLGPDGLLLAGLGYATSDGLALARNPVERAHLERFLAEAQLEGRAPTEGPPEGAASGRGPAGSEKGTEAARSSAREDAVERPVHSDEALHEGLRAEPAPGLDRSEASTAERPPTRDEERHGGGGQGKDRGDEGEEQDPRPSGGWAAGEPEPREGRRAYRVDGADPFGSSTRCRGALEDGSRCLRKPIPGTPYCRAHRST